MVIKHLILSTYYALDLQLSFITIIQLKADSIYILDAISINFRSKKEITRKKRSVPIYDEVMAKTSRKDHVSTLFVFFWFWAFYLHDSCTYLLHSTNY